MLLKLINYPNLPVQIDIVNYPPKRLKSKNPIWSLTRSNKTTEEIWSNRLLNTNVRNHSLVIAPLIAEFQAEACSILLDLARMLNRAQWTALNRKRTGQGGCNYLSKKLSITQMGYDWFSVVRVRFNTDYKPYRWGMPMNKIWWRCCNTAWLWTNGDQLASGNRCSTLTIMFKELLDILLIF